MAMTPQSEALLTQDREDREEWKQELLHSYSSLDDLTRDRLISAEESQKLKGLGDRFKIRITPYYANLMENSLHCPIRRQAIPELGENDPTLPEWVQALSQEVYGRPTPWHADAIGDLANLAAPRLTHRYRNRAILHLSSMCAVYCRFCFRKSHLNDSERTLYEGSLEPAFQYLKTATEMREIILTGGDPLSLTDAALGRVFERINQIPHLRTLRIHSRMAVTLPSRFTERLLNLFGRPWNFQISLVSHFNHPKEITSQALSRLYRLKRAGVTLLNQSVLLNGINSSSECLRTLFQSLYEAGVIPYYLHHPDWTPGTFHFRVSIERGRQLMKELRGTVPGPALPDYILDIPHGYGKVSLLGAEIRKVEDFSEASSKIRGALYELVSPRTLKGQGENRRYLDLFPSDNESPSSATV